MYIRTHVYMFICPSKYIGTLLHIYISTRLQNVIDILFLSWLYYDAPMLALIATDAVPEELLNHFSDGEALLLSNGLDFLH